MNWSFNDQLNSWFLSDDAGFVIGCVENTCWWFKSGHQWRSGYEVDVNRAKAEVEKALREAELFRRVMRALLIPRASRRTLKECCGR